MTKTFKNLFKTQRERRGKIFKKTFKSLFNLRFWRETWWGWWRRWWRMNSDVSESVVSGGGRVPGYVTWRLQATNTTTTATTTTTTTKRSRDGCVHRMSVGCQHATYIDIHLDCATTPTPGIQVHVSSRSRVFPLVEQGFIHDRPCWNGAY